MPKPSVTSAIQASADTVWETISDFNGLPKFMEPIADSKTEGDGIGAIRTLTLQDGGSVIERLETFDPATRTLSYSMTSAGPMPFVNYVATMEVKALSDQQCELTWWSVFETKDGVADEEAVGIAESVYHAGIAGLKKLHES